MVETDRQSTEHDFTLPLELSRDREEEFGTGCASLTSGSNSIIHITIFFFQVGTIVHHIGGKVLASIRYVVSGLISSFDTKALLAMVGFIVCHSRCSSKTHVLLLFLWRFSGLYIIFLDVLIESEGNRKATN